MDNSKYSGYVSDQAKRKFTISVGVLGGIFFFAQFIVPFIIMIAFMPLMIFSGGFELKNPQPQRGTLWNDNIWYVETAISSHPTTPPEYILKTIPNDEDPAPITAAKIPFGRSWLLADAERLWIISSTGVGYFADGTIQVLNNSQTIGDITRPFFLKGKPAVIEESPAGYTLMVFSSGNWQVRQSFTMDRMGESSCCAEDIQILSDQEELHFFMKSGDTIFYRVGLPAGPQLDRESWQPVVEANHYWYATFLGDQPAVFSARPSQRNADIIGLQLKDDRWRSFFSYDQSLPGNLGVFWNEVSNSFFILIESFPGALKLLEFNGSELVGESRFGGGFPFPRKMMAFMFIPHAFGFILPLILAIILSRMMAKSRLCDYEAELGKIAYASITRRAVAQIIDLVIVGGPAVLIGLFFFFSFWDMENLLISGPSEFFVGFGLFALCFLWIICCYFIFSFLEGAYGRTPGKWATGIRVLGADLKPCGIGRALLRNLLKVADGFFNFMVGIMLVALTQNWQRVGDMAARTVVVRAEPIARPLPKGITP